MNTTASFLSAIIGTEVLSIIICLVLLLGSIIEGGKESKRTKWFILLVICVLIGCLCDLISWVLDGHPERNLLLCSTTLCSMLMTIVIIGVFISYLSAYVSERKKISNISAMIGWIAVAIGVSAVFIAGITGNLFTFQNGSFSEKPLYTVYVIANTGYLLIGILVITVYRKVLDRYDKLGAYTYILIPVISTTIGLFVDGWDFSYPAIVVSLLILYIMLQSDRSKRLENEGIIASYQAEHDALTGLYNRKAYQDRLCLIKSKEEDSGVIFGDLNGLKYVNDNFGHEAGDQLLIRFAKVLTDSFRIDDIYRISGDEFIIILENVPEELFQKRISELKEVLNLEEPPLASLGAAYGRGGDIEKLCRDAENRMYEEKEIVHKTFPRTNR